MHVHNKEIRGEGEGKGKDWQERGGWETKIMEAKRGVADVPDIYRYYLSVPLYLCTVSLYFIHLFTSHRLSLVHRDTCICRYIHHFTAAEVLHNNSYLQGIANEWSIVKVHGDLEGGPILSGYSAFIFNIYHL